MNVKGKDREAYLSQYKESSKTTDYFLNEKGEKTTDPTLHVHVIHDDSKGEVRMHITDRRNGAEVRDKISPLTRPSGNEVNAAEARLVAILRSKK